MKEITVEELKEIKDKNESITLLDVREPFEAYISNIEVGSGKSIPLDDLASRLHELDKQDQIVAICRSGVRSAKACKLLEQEGFENVVNLKGGINQWAKEIDDSLPVY